MNGYYWKGETGWFWRENKQTPDWHGPFSSRAAAKDARADYYDRIEKPLVVRV